jgi:HEAT repeat protein
LKRGVRSNPDLSLKMAAADGLGDVGDAYAAGVLQTLYYSVGAFDRRIVANAIADTEASAARKVLIDAANGGDQTLRLAGLQGLGKLGDRRAVPLLERVMNDSSIAPIERAMAATSLLRLCVGVDLNVLRELVTDRRDGNARAIAAIALGYANDTSVLPLLHQAMSDVNTDVQIGAAAALTYYQQPAAVEYLKTAMVDTGDPVTRQHVAQVLDQVAFSGGYPVLIAAVGSADPNLEMAGVHALGLHGGQKEIVLLEQMLPHVKDPLMRAQIAWSLGRISQPASIDALIGLVQERDPAVRYTAADALDRIAQRLANARG